MSRQRYGGTLATKRLFAAEPGAERDPEHEIQRVGAEEKREG